MRGQKASVFSACFCSGIVTIVIIVTIKFNVMENDKEIIIKKYLSAFEPVVQSGESRVERGNQSGVSRVESGERESLMCNVKSLTESSSQGRVVVKTSEDIIRELEDIVELETNDVVAVMLAEGYDLMRRNEVFGWAMRLR